MAVAGSSRRIATAVGNILRRTRAVVCGSSDGRTLTCGQRVVEHSGRMATAEKRASPPLVARLGVASRMVSALRYAQFRRYWFGNLAAVSGQQMMWVAQGWLVYRLTDSALYLGYVGLATALPAILLNLVGGVVADRATGFGTRIR